MSKIYPIFCGITVWRPELCTKRLFLYDNVSVRVLVVEDDKAIATSLILGLQSAGMTVTHVATGAQAIAATDFDVMLLDIGLPDLDGFEVCRQVRLTSRVPIIMLTARADEIDRVFGLETGADDYVAKPFGLRELVARIRAVTRRITPQDSAISTTTVIGDLTVDSATRRVTVSGAEIELTTKEFDLLEYLTNEPGVVHRRNEILETVWDTEWYGPTKTLDAHVAALRKKLGHPDWITAVRGVGFRFEINS